MLQQEVLLCFTEFQATSFPRKGFGATELRNIKNGSPPKKTSAAQLQIVGRAGARLLLRARALQPISDQRGLLLLLLLQLFLVGADRSNFSVPASAAAAA